MTARARLNERAVWILITAVTAATAVIAAPVVRGEFQIEEVGSLAAFGGMQLKPSTIAFADHSNDESTDSATGLIRFEDWTRARPVQKQFLSLYPGSIEPTTTMDWPVASATVMPPSADMSTTTVRPAVARTKSRGWSSATTPSMRSTSPALTTDPLSAMTTHANSKTIRTTVR